MADGFASLNASTFYPFNASTSQRINLCPPLFVLIRSSRFICVPFLSHLFWPVTMQRYKTVPRVVKRGGRFGGDLTKMKSEEWRTKNHNVLTIGFFTLHYSFFTLLCCLTIVKSGFVRIIQKCPFLVPPRRKVNQKRTTVNFLRRGWPPFQERASPKSDSWQLTVSKKSNS